MKKLWRHPLTEWTRKYRGNVQVHVAINLNDTAIGFQFEFQDPQNEIRWTGRGTPGERFFGLWETTCAEVFWKNLDSPAYAEANVSPSGAWNVFSFSDRRSGMTQPSFFGIQNFRKQSQQLYFDLPMKDFLAAVPLGQFKSLRLSLSAVVELNTGEKLYFASHIQPGPPDFHHPHNFQIQWQEGST